MTTRGMAWIGSPDRLSTCTICLAGAPLGEALEVIADAGFRKIDLLGRMPHFSIDPAEFDVGELERHCARLGLHVAGIGSYFGKDLRKESGADAVEAEVKAAGRGIEIAARLGARVIRVGVGDRAHETAFALVPFLTEVARLADRHGIRVGVETHGGITSDPQGMAELCGRVGCGNFGVIYDPCNLLADGVDYRRAYEELRRHVVHVHLKDGRRNESGRRLTHFGEGEIDMAWILKQLDADGYDGEVALEYEIGKVESPRTGLVKWRQRYEQLVATLA